MILFSIDIDAKVEINHINMVNEYPEMFLKEVSSLPLECEVVFSIEQVLGMGLISNAPYIMSPSELVELKKQFKELLEKYFILLSVLPWGITCFIY